MQVKLNGDVDVINLEAYLPDMGLAPDALEIAVPSCFRDDRAEVGKGPIRTSFLCLECQIVHS